LEGETLMAVRPTWITIRTRRVSFRLDRRVLPVALVLTLVTFAALVISINYGQYNMTAIDVVLTLFGLNTDHPDTRNFALVVHTFRLPRILVAFLVGAALAAAGTIMQGITRNPLADPYLLGVSGGASLVAVAVIVWLDDVPLSALPFATFAGGLIVAFAIYFFAWRKGSSSPIRLILIGIGLSAMVSSLTTVMLLFGNINDVQQAYVWLTGSVYGRNWDHVRALGGWLLVFLPLAFVLGGRLNLLNLGDDTAKGLGMRVERGRAALLLISVALTAAAVAVAGTIGFVGLIAPHITRRLVGPSHEGLLPISALFGGALVVTADLIGRAVVAPSELPVGIVTAMIGAPYFAFLLIRSRTRT
jgi:iron complex transport system permease protein